VAENVPGILQGKYEEIRKEALQKVTNDYVILEPLRLKASDFGAPTTRERVFFIGCRSDVAGTISCEDFEVSKVDNMITVDEALKGLLSDVDSNWLTEEESWRPVESLPDTPFWNRIKAYIPEGVGDAESLRRYNEESVVSGCFGTRHSQEIMERYNRLKPGERDKISKSVRLVADGFCPTLRAGTNSDRGGFQAVRPIHPTLPRVITPREAARLQGFPDWFRFAPNKWQSFRQIGNSISPIVSEIIFKVIKGQLDLNVEPDYEWKNI
jgi:DNA (cytosine-5)-methyltransferase 1